MLRSIEVMTDVGDTGYGEGKKNERVRRGTKERERERRGAKERERESDEPKRARYKFKDRSLFFMIHVEKMFPLTLGENSFVLKIVLFLDFLHSLIVQLCSKSAFQ